MLGKDHRCSAGYWHRLRAEGLGRLLSALPSWPRTLGCLGCRGGAVRAFQGAQNNPQISATYQEGLGDRRVTFQAGTRTFLRFSIKNESIQGSCCGSGTPSAFPGRRHSIGQRPGEPSPVIGPIWERKQGRHREGRWFAQGHTAGRW